MNRILSILICAIMLFSPLASPKQVSAIEDPLSKPNNKFGIHILFDSELDEAARLINSNGGQWGYVVIPIQAGDRNLEKWQTFMDNARRLKLIPIVRLATEGDYFNTKVWRKPKEEDILDFANFLNSLSWPLKNQYVIVFNEVNRDDEWGGKADPKEYAELLSYATTIFKSLDQNFFILTSGLDNASINGNGAINKLTYLSRMQQSVPGIFDQVDGLVSHAYPNPAFAQPPTIQHVTSIASFRFERSLIGQYTKKRLPIFITETGWSSITIPDESRASYYRDAFSSVWSDPDIVAVTPFLLHAGSGPFEEFSFITTDGKPTKQYESFAGMEKTPGRPTLNSIPIPTQKQVLAAQSSENATPSVWFPPEEKQKRFSKTQAATGMFSWFFGL